MELTNSSYLVICSLYANMRVCLRRSTQAQVDELRENIPFSARSCSGATSRTSCAYASTRAIARGILRCTRIDLICRALRVIRALEKDREAVRLAHLASMLHQTPRAMPSYTSFRVALKPSPTQGLTRPPILYLLGLTYALLSQRTKLS
ncbi:hypothetical protein PENSPDRAFT_264599 [Peniophora sp. CONT]|nr:hypothetical protein PENSPDRAFT_264599 [Peniophora sp. CONT]